MKLYRIDFYSSLKTSLEDFHIYVDSLDVVNNYIYGNVPFFRCISISSFDVDDI